MSKIKDPLQSSIRFTAESSFAYGTPMHASTQGRQAAPKGKPRDPNTALPRGRVRRRSQPRRGLRIKRGRVCFSFVEQNKDPLQSSIPFNFPPPQAGRKQSKEGVMLRNSFSATSLFWDNRYNTFYHFVLPGGSR